MIVDLTPPEAGVIVDGLEPNFHDVAFSSESATITSQWENYTDPESGIRDHKVSVYRKRDGRLVNKIPTFLLHLISKDMLLQYIIIHLVLAESGRK